MKTGLQGQTTSLDLTSYVTLIKRSKSIVNFCVNISFPLDFSLQSFEIISSLQKFLRNVQKPPVYPSFTFPSSLYLLLHLLYYLSSFWICVPCSKHCRFLIVCPSSSMLTKSSNYWSLINCLLVLLNFIQVLSCYCRLSPSFDLKLLILDLGWSLQHYY